MGGGKGGGSPSGTTTTTTNSAPWAAQQPYLQDIFGSAQNLYQNYRPQYYPGLTYAGPTADQYSGLTDTSSLARGLLDQSTQSAQYSAPALDQRLTSGSYLNSNPATTALTYLANNNLGVNAASPALYALANNGVDLSAPYSALQGYAAGNSVNQFSPYSGEGVHRLTNLADNGADLSAGNSALSTLAGSNLGTGNTGSSLLQQLAQGNFPANFAAPGYWAGNAELTNLANGHTGLDQPANYLSGLASTNAGAAPGVGNSALTDYASGKYLAEGNPNTSQTAQSVLANIVPSIESQFIQGGGLSSPQAAFATSQGASAALAPLLFNQYNTQQQLQQGAANQLTQNQLSGAGLQTVAAQGLANTYATQAGIQQTAGNSLANQYLQTAQQQQNAAQQYAQNALAGGGLQQGAAQGLINSGLGQATTQQNASNSLLNLYTGQQQLQLGAAQNLGNLLLGQGGLQQSAANTLGNQYLSGLNTQLQGAQGLGNQYNQSVQQMIQGLALYPQTQQGAFTAPSQLYSSGAQDQANQQAYINDQLQRFNYQQILPYQLLNEYIGQVSGNYGGVSNTTSPYFQNQGANALGGALGGALLGSQLLGPAGLTLTSSGVGAGLGAGAGLLLGLI